MLPSFCAEAAREVDRSFESSGLPSKFVRDHSSCGSSPRSANLCPTDASALTISAKLPVGTQGSSYNGSVTASGGTAPYKFAVTSGQLPAGVNLDQASGNVTGTPSATGTFNFGVTVRDSKGAFNEQGLQINVGQAAPPPPPSPAPSTPPPSNSAPTNNERSSFSNLQAAAGWGQYGQGPPDFVDCSPSPCNGIEFSMTQGASSPSLSGKATVFWLGGTAPYSDALWNNHLIGPYSSQGMFDPDQSKTSSLSTFTYDVDFYGDNLGLSEALEFDWEPKRIKPPVARMVARLLGTRSFDLTILNPILDCVLW